MQEAPTNSAVEPETQGDQVTQEAFADRSKAIADVEQAKSNLVTIDEHGLVQSARDQARELAHRQNVGGPSDETTTKV